jgi:hypothetical protein
MRSPRGSLTSVVLAKAGTQSRNVKAPALGPRLRGGDEENRGRVWKN